MVRVVSTVSAFQELAEVSPDDRERAWLERYEAAHSSLFASYYSAWGDRDARAVAAARAPALAPLLPERETRTRRLVEQAAGVLRGEGLLPNEDVTAVLMVGVGSSNGWVASWPDAPALFLALELLPEPPFDEVLVTHELIHLAHERRQPAPGRRRSGRGCSPRAWPAHCPGSWCPGWRWTPTCGSTTPTGTGWASASGTAGS